MANPPLSYADLLGRDAAAVRAAIRLGQYGCHTAGLATGRLQCNLAIVPERVALDFVRFCQRNPKPCPIVGIGDTGNPILPTLGRNIDVRTDLPRYRVMHDGAITGEVSDISDLWADDLVTVALGCSFTFEHALMAEGIPVRHIERNRTVPMFRSNIPLNRAGPFWGEMVLTMRPIANHRIADAWRISARYPFAHGAPIGKGDPEQFGVDDLSRPDWGDAIEVGEEETPIFWACGVTSQNVLMTAGLPLCITHAPGHMLVTDIDQGAETPVFTHRGD